MAIALGSSGHRGSSAADHSASTSARSVAPPNGTSVTETVYRHEIRPALTTGATAMNKILSKKRTKSA
jgi:hypothetical protein